MRSDSHNHAPDLFAVSRGKLLKEIHAKVAQDPTTTVRCVYDKCVDEGSEESDELPTFDNVRTRIKRHRSKFVPAIPTCVNDVAINGEWSKTSNGHRFLSLLDNNWGIVICTTKRFLKVLQQCDCIYIDGTFRTAPRPYVQFLTIHALYNGFVVPLVFCLLTNKTTAQYRQVLQHVKRRILTVTRRQWQPSRVVLDFEMSMMIALQTELQHTRISGCYFHWTQSLWRNFQTTGLVRECRTNRKLRGTVRRVMAIAFLPVLLVRLNFNILRTSRRTQRLIGRHPPLDDWLDYVEQTYITANSMFPPHTWNVFDRRAHNRTNNHLEGKHSQVTRCTYLCAIEMYCWWSVYFKINNCLLSVNT